MTMNTDDFNECRDSFIAERVAMLIFDGGMKELDAEREARRMWERYRRTAGIFENEQRGLM